jgi:polar amino acid transport system substrate-binding protein
MKFLRLTGTALLVGVLAAASLGLAGCFAIGKDGSLSLPAATITSPDITEDGVLYVGVDSSHAPFAGVAGTDVIGIDVDIAYALAEQMGLKARIVDIAGEDASAVIREGRSSKGEAVDVVMGIQTGIANAATTPFTEAQVGPYLVDGPAAFTVGLSSAPSPQGFDPAQLNGMKIVAQEGSLSAWQVSKSYGDDSLITYPTLNKAFDELGAGTVSYAAADAIVGSFLAVQYENIRCEGMLAEPQGVYMGVATDRHELAGKLTDALRSLRDGGNLQIIVAKWLGPVSAQTVLSTQAIVATPTTDGTGGAEGAGGTEGSTGTEGAPTDAEGTDPAPTDEAPLAERPTPPERQQGARL